jgi:glycerol uptake facilitator-like aquaporin
VTHELRRLTAEMMGTLLLVATIVGSGIMAGRLTDDTAIALLANSLATGAVLVVVITILAPISGAHFNPAVTLVFALRRELPWSVATLYVVAQVAGGVGGTLLAHAMFEMPLLQVSLHARFGPAQWLAEGVATFGLIFTILAGRRSRPDWVPLLVGAYIVAAYWFTASTSFANPAVTIARALTETFAGIRPFDAPGFIVAQLVGAIAGKLVAGALTSDRRANSPS